MGAFRLGKASSWPGLLLKRTLLWCKTQPIWVLAEAAEAFDGRHEIIGAGQRLVKRVSASRVPVTRPAMLSSILESRFWSALNPTNMVP